MQQPPLAARASAVWQFAGYLAGAIFVAIICFGLPWLAEIGRMVFMGAK